jgi:hypothetical protein
VPLKEKVKLRSDPEPDFSRSGSESSQNGPDLPPVVSGVTDTADSGVIDTAHHRSLMSFTTPNDTTENKKSEFLKSNISANSNL